MIDRPPFNPLQAQQVAEAFNLAGVRYLFIDKSGAILLGYPGTTQDVDVFPAKSVENGNRILRAILALGFVLARECFQWPTCGTSSRASERAAG